MACETEMHIHYMMLAQDHFREALHLTRTSDRLDKIVHALESLDDAQHWVEVYSEQQPAAA